MLAPGNVKAVAVDVLVRCVDPRCNQCLYERFQDAWPFTYFGASLDVHQSAHRFLADLGKMRKFGLTVSTIYFVDHSDCLAYSHWLGERYAANSALWHRQVLTSVAKELQWLEPKLAVELLLLDLESGQLVPC